MGALKLLVFAGLALAAPAGAQSLDRWAGDIAEASARFEVPESWIRRVIQAESGGQTMLNGRPIRSMAGAIGLMQLMPGTWRDMREAYGLGPDPDDPRDNILAGTAYLRFLYERFGYPGLFGAYNAGPTRYADSVARRRRLPAETLAYLKQVTAADGAAPSKSVALTMEPRRPSLFVLLRPGPEASRDTSAPPLRPGASLFASLSGAAAPNP
jgi:soluble lytic murein transglycosylase-like protein